MRYFGDKSAIETDTSHNLIGTFFDNNPCIFYAYIHPSSRRYIIHYVLIFVQHKTSRLVIVYIAKLSYKRPSLLSRLKVNVQ